MLPLDNNMVVDTTLSIESTCPHCYPDQINHRQEKLNSILISFFNRPFSLLLNLLTLNHPLYLTDRYLVLTIIILQKINKIQRQRFIQVNQTVNRLQLLWNEAQKRQLEIYSFSMLNHQLLSFLLVYHGKNYYFHYSPTTLLHKHFKKYQDPAHYDNKFTFKKTLQQHHLPTPEGKLFYSTNKAFNYGKKLGFPLVVKPASSTFSHHVILNINDLAALNSAIHIVKMIECGVIVERFISGDTHRMMEVGGQFLVCSKRTRPSIIGNGRVDISTLIDEFNNNPLRGDLDESGFALFKIKKNETLNAYLANQGLSLSTILVDGRKIYLAEKSNCSNGAEVINLSEKVCAENIRLFETLHKSLGIAVSAVDFICEDITQPWFTQSFAFLENNSFPAIDPQHYPSAGQSVDVAKAIWDLVMRELDTLSLGT